LIASIKKGKLINSENASNTQRSGPYPDDMYSYILQYTSWKIFACNNSKITKAANKNITYISYLKKVVTVSAVPRRLYFPALQ
jgi:hypothetical protein